MDDTSKDRYFTKDLYEAAFLYASNLTLLKLEKNNKHFFFVFQEKNKAEKLRDSFWSGNATISPNRYAESIKSLKERLFANKVSLS